MVKEISLEPLDVIAVGLHEGDSAAVIVPIDWPRERIRICTVRFNFFAGGHQHWKIHAPISCGLDVAEAGREFGGFEFVAAVPTENRRKRFKPFHYRCRG